MSGKEISLTLALPVYNGANHICHSLDSIFKQSFKNFKLIIYVNKSQDKTLSICKKYKKKYKNKIKIFKHNKFVSGYKNLISVLKKVETKYVLLCSHDDIFKEKKYIERLVKKLSDNIVPFGKINVIDNQNNILTHISNNNVYNFSEVQLIRRLKFFFTPSLSGKNCIYYGIQEKKNFLKILLNKKIKYLDPTISDNYINYMNLKNKKAVHVKGVTLMKRIKNHEKKILTFGSKKNKIKAVLLNLKSQLNYIYFSNFLETIVILIMFPINLFYERSILFFFNKVNNKVK